MFLQFYKHRIRRSCIFLSILMVGLGVLWSINTRTLPYLRSIATYQVKSYVNTLLRESVDKQFENVNKSEGSYDVLAIRKQLSYLVEEVSEVLVNSSETEIIYELPLGALTENIWLVNWGPKIPIKMRMLQEVRGEVASEVVEYGLNNALLTIDILLYVEVEVISPYHVDEISMISEIPLVIDVIEGDVPTFVKTW